MRVWLFFLFLSLVRVWGAIMVLGVCMYYLTVFLLPEGQLSLSTSIQVICRSLDSPAGDLISIAFFSNLLLPFEIDATHELMK